MGTRFNTRLLTTGSEAGALQRGVPQPCHITQRRRAEVPLVLAAEVRAVVVPDAIAGTGGVEGLVEHQSPGRLQPPLRVWSSKERISAPGVRAAWPSHPHGQAFFFTGGRPVQGQLQVTPQPGLKMTWHVDRQH